MIKIKKKEFTNGSLGNDLLAEENCVIRPLERKG
jgi:hypothetical protein